MITAYSLTCEHLQDPTGVPFDPRFSWKLRADGNCVMQTQRRIQVAVDEGFADCVWDSGVSAGDQSVLVPYAGVRLKPHTRYWWRVKVWDNRGGESEWSETATFVTALDCWAAPFISAERPESGASSAGNMLRGEFTLKAGIKTAILNATALGVYKVHLNGGRIGDWVMTPGWTEYGSRLLYQSYDVTSLVHEGRNAAGAMVGPGWYKGDLAGWLGRRNVYGTQTAFSMDLVVVYADGSVESHRTGDDWKAFDGPVKFSEIYHGEEYDARLEIPGWDTAGYDAAWRSVYPVEYDSRLVVPQDGPPVRSRETLTPGKIYTAPNGEVLVDFEQLLTGWIRLKVKGKAGDVVTYSHAEILDKDGNFYTRNLRSAKQRISYTLKGGEEEIYEPLFTFQGFRYLRIDAFPGECTKDNFTAVVAHSDMPETGHFESSHAKLNQLEKNIRWGMKGNFFDIPTDCPQRDERLGWTGDAQVFVRAACYLHDVGAFFRKWLRDLAASQFPNGGVPNVVPDVISGYMQDGDPAQTYFATGWGDAGVICPWTVYKYFGDKRMLAEQYPSMKAWVEFIRSQSQWGLLWNTGRHLGDWVAIDAKEGSYIGATPTDMIATAYYAYSSGLLAKAAAVLGKDDEAERYAKLREDIRAAFVKEYMSANGRICARTQTAQILALYFDLVPHEFRQRTIDTLVEILAEYDDHLSTGFLGTPYICYALSDNGRLDLAYKLLLREDYPSWLYPLSKGATTIWEHWDGIKPDGSMWSDRMNSFNHYAYGAVADWMYSVIGGIDSEESGPGFKRSIIAPRPGGGITSAKTSQETLYGLLSSEWKLDGGCMTLDVSIPPNTTATVTLPMGKVVESAGLSPYFSGQGHSVEVGSGNYRFIVRDVELA